MDSVEDKRHWERKKKERFPCLTNSDPEKHVTMVTKGFSWNLFGSLQSSGENPSVSARKRKDHTARGSSPKSDTAVQAVRQREHDQEEQWKRQREIERIREWRRERERGLAQGHKGREKESVGTAQERERRYIKLGKEERRQYERLASEKTGKERSREYSIFHQMPETSRERVERLIKSMCREGDGPTKPQERQRGMEREEISHRERKVGRPRDEQRDIQRNRDMERWNDRGKEYRKNGGGVRDKEVQLEKCEIWKEPSPRYRHREVWEEKELQGERERGRDREREGGRTNQYERSRGHRPAERLRIPETETEQFSDREGWERNRQRHRVIKSDGDGEGDILQGREIDPPRGLQQKQSRSEGDGEEKGRERYMDGWGYKERDMQRGKKQDKTKARYRDIEGRRENDRYRDRLMQTDMDRYNGRQRVRGPETGREGTQSRLMGNWQIYGEKGRDPMKYSREERQKHRSPGRERYPKKQGDLESKSIDEHWTDTRSRPWGYGSDVECGKKEKERQTTQDKRQRPSRMRIDSQKEGLEITEREAVHEQCVDEDIQMPMDEGEFTGGEESDSEWDENEGNGKGAERKPERDREDEDENDKWLGKEMCYDGDLESENDAQSKTQEDINQNLTEDVMGSTDEGESDVGNVSEECYPSENEGESGRQEKQEERMEDGLATVSSGGEEEQKETIEDGKEFLQCAATSDEDLQSVEFQNAEQMKKGTEQHERDDGDRTLEGEDESTNELTDMGEDLDLKRNRVVEMRDSKALEGKKGDDDGDDDGDGDDEDDGDGDDDGGNGDDDDKKVTVFFVVGQTLCKNEGCQQTEELNTDLGPDNGSVPPLAESENDIDKEKEVGKDTEKSDDESSLDTLCVSKKPHGDGNSEIPLESNNSKDTDQYLNEDGGYGCFENGRIVMTEENEPGTENTFTSSEEKRHTEPCVDLPSEPGDGRENKSMFTANRKSDKEPCSEHESDNQRQTEPISRTTDESTCRNNVEQCKEEATSYLKSPVDIRTEIPDTSEDGPTEKWEESPEMDTQDTSDPVTNCEDDKNTEACIQINTHTYSDMLTNNEKEEMKNSELSTDAYMESDPIIVVSVRENAQVGADTGIQMTAEDESCTNSETDQICHSPITKRTLSKSDSCPSPVSSPSKSPTSATKGVAEQRWVIQNEEEDSCCFQNQADEALLRRRMCRKATDRCKYGENESGRIISSRVFDVSDDDKLSLSCGEAELRTSDSLRRPKKKNSRFFNSQLYQEYCEVVQNQEILLQSCSDATSPTLPHLSSQLSRRPLPPVPSYPHPHSLYQSNTLPNTSTRSLPLLPPPPRSSSPRFSASFSLSPTLWQDLPGVRKSSELSDLNEDERRLQEVRFEVVTSEASYCRSLDIAVDHFVKSKQLAVLLSAQDKNWLFSRLREVRALSYSFLSRLEEQVERDVMHFTVCDIIIRYCPRFRLVYVPYLTNQSYQDKTYQRLMDECPGFRRVVETLERSPVCQRLPLRSFLVLPFQRITRLKLLVQNIVKRSVSNTKEEVQAIKALKLLEKLIKESNDSITQMKSIESLVSLSFKVDFGCKTLPLVSQSRRLIREGSVAEMCDFALKETERTVYLHLFNDYLLLSLQKESGRFSVIDYAPTEKIRVENCRIKLHSLQKNVFRLHLPPKKALLLRSDTHSDKLRWMSALSRPHPDIDFTMAQDLTQVQCVKAFVAQQPDEISLEKADVLLVHQQSSDGWVEGTRLSDRQRGWAPEGHLEPIVNARARQRNLLDTQKIKTATATH
ncbi:uncharacterized protein arhgef5 isoform X2 [Brienomyrus brachyistius]|uniref:uncharacterized protein arhgef5 isoform X2 n=1 Tax=Brienomyrus brachyistius TaxID=42636 RepID=UPI0020B331DB|nr:uncharacterized protein arhgef5 isoform X2 [Brienomyrus brachyistius]